MFALRLELGFISAPQLGRPVPQGLKPGFLRASTARLKQCPTQNLFIKANLFMKTALLLFGLGRRQILRETLQRHFARTGSGFLRRIGAVLDQNSLEHVIRFVAPALALSALNRPAKFESNTLHGRGDKLKSIPLQFPRLEKVIEKAALAIRF